ncbi:MAG: hypothetical protein ABI583_06435 [Betaproteobacteria bacterium]
MDKLELELRGCSGFSYSWADLKAILIGHQADIISFQPQGRQVAKGGLLKNSLRGPQSSCVIALFSSIVTTDI